MKGLKPRKVIAEKKAMQKVIKKKYPELVQQYTQELCHAPCWRLDKTEECYDEFLPVTLDGEKCPYFKPK